MSDIAIDIKKLDKVFRLYPDLVLSRIKQNIFFRRKYYEEKIALRDINLQIKKGEVVGIIGPNGAGKTTLLKIIAGISYPTNGKIYCSNQVIAVLALGLGFHPRLTGLENITLGGTMLGMSKRDVLGKIDWIIDFAELHDYIDKPLTTYSSGMQARLSFAVAACQEPDILIIDEALATGDIRFVQKCINRIHEIVATGTTALFVSHNIWSIKKLTERCILLDDGKIVDDGETNIVADRYYEVMLKNEVFEKTKKQNDLEKFVGSGEVYLNKIQLMNHEGKESDIIYSGLETKIILEVENTLPSTRLQLVLEIWRNDGISACSTFVAGGGMGQDYNFTNIIHEISKGRQIFEICFSPILLAPGDFYINLHIYNPDDHSGYSSNQQFYYKTHILEFGVRKSHNPNRSMLYYQPTSIILKDTN